MKQTIIFEERDIKVTRDQYMRDGKVVYTVTDVTDGTNGFTTTEPIPLSYHSLRYELDHYANEKKEALEAECREGDFEGDLGESWDSDTEGF